MVTAVFKMEAVRMHSFRKYLHIWYAITAATKGLERLGRK